MDMHENGEMGSGSGAVDHFDAQPVSQRVVEGVVDTLGVDISAIEPLYTVIDPDALNNLFGPTSEGIRTGGKVVFTMAGCEVVVDELGTVDVTPIDDAEGSSAGREAGTASE